MEDETYTGFTLTELEEELRREKQKQKTFSVFRSTVSLTIIVIAAVTLLNMYVFPILRIGGSSMEPALDENDIIVVFREKNLKQGDIAAFYLNNTVLVKRIVAVSGDTVEMEENGKVIINGEVLEEPYLDDTSYGECDIAFPYTVPDAAYFVMGDHRSVSIDSRNSAVGCIPKNQMMGKVLFRIWPLIHSNKTGNQVEKAGNQHETAETAE